MAYVIDVIDRTSRAFAATAHAHWLLRVPLALVLMQYGLEKFPLSAEIAAGWGLPLWVWALAGVGEIAIALLLITSGFLRGAAGTLATRIAGFGASIIVAGVIVVAYWAPPLDLLMFNQFHILLLGASLYPALSLQPR